MQEFLDSFAKGLGLGIGLGIVFGATTFAALVVFAVRGAGMRSAKPQPKPQGR
jgi:hypothetical protein